MVHKRQAVTRQWLAVQEDLLHHCLAVTEMDGKKGRRERERVRERQRPGEMKERAGLVCVCVGNGVVFRSKITALIWGPGKHLALY